jgi:hypothetical protein
VIAGEVSVKPYPSITGKPISSKKRRTSTDAAPPPDAIRLKRKQ